MKNCEVCKKEIDIDVDEVRIEHGNTYCSTECYQEMLDADTDYQLKVFDFMRDRI